MGLRDTPYIKGEMYKPARKRDKVKLWIVRHQEMIAIAGVGTFVVVGGYYLIKWDLKAQAKAREAEAALVASLNKILETEQQIRPLYPVPPAA